MIRDDIEEIGKLKKHLAKEFEIKDLRKLKYFLGIEVAYLRNDISISQQKYILNLLKETDLLRCKPFFFYQINTRM